MELRPYCVSSSRGKRNKAASACQRYSMVRYGLEDKGPNCCEPARALGNWGQSGQSSGGSITGRWSGPCRRVK